MRARMRDHEAKPLTAQDYADEYGVGLSTVYRHGKELGVTFAKPSDPVQPPAAEQPVPEVR